VLVGVSVAVSVTVLVAVEDVVAVFVGVKTKVPVAVLVGTRVDVLVGVSVGVLVLVAVGVIVGVGRQFGVFNANLNVFLILPATARTRIEYLALNLDTTMLKISDAPLSKVLNWGVNSMLVNPGVPVVPVQFTP
jgi:hypothetical protein